MSLEITFLRKKSAIFRKKPSKIVKSDGNFLIKNLKNLVFLAENPGGDQSDTNGT